MRVVVAFVSGLVFAIGLAVSQMTDPMKVQAFLDVGGAWDPSLAFVMGGAVLFHVGFARWALRRERPVFDRQFHYTTETQVDRRLIAGAALFGVGWGAGGYCPGPALVSAGEGSGGALLFTVAMIAGIWLFHATRPKKESAG